MAKKARFNVGRLCENIKRSRLTLRRFREERREAVRQYVGSHYSEDGSIEKVPVNQISLFINIIGRSLIADNPRIMLSTFDRSLKPQVSAMESWLAKELPAMNFAETMQRVVLDAMFSVGVVKVALSTPSDSAKAAWNLPAGAPFVAPVDLDDFAVDIHARSFEEVSWICHRYRVHRDTIVDSKLYSKRRKDLEPSYDASYNAEGDERVNMIGRGYYGQYADEFEDMVDLWEIYLPRHRLILTLADDDLTGPTANGSEDLEEAALRVQNWVGPEKGPYHVMAFGTVPGNLMPKSPIHDLIDLHLQCNDLWRKMDRQGARFKDVTFVSGRADADGNRVLNGNDGDMIRVDNPDQIQNVKFGGPDQTLMGLFMSAKQMYNQHAGNLDLMGGLAPQSKTATQDQMLNTNGSRITSDMQQQATTCVARVAKALCWYWWHDPYLEMRSQYSLPGVTPPITLQRKVKPEDRIKGKFEDLQIETDPYSMQFTTPQQRLQTLMGLMRDVIVPMAPIMQQQQIVPDMNKFLEKVGKYANMPDLPEILTTQGDQPPETTQAGDQQQEVVKPGSTTRNYVRESTSDRTPEATNRDLVMRMMGHNPGGKSGNVPQNGNGMQ